MGKAVEYSLCLVKNPDACKYVSYVITSAFCQHPDRRSFEKPDAKLMNPMTVALTRQGTGTPCLIVPKKITSALYALLHDHRVKCQNPELLSTQTEHSIELTHNQMMHVEQVVDMFFAQRGVKSNKTTKKAIDEQPESFGISWLFDGAEFV